MIVAFAIALFSSDASAVPVQYTQQGRLLDSVGAAVSGTEAITFRIFDAPTAGVEIWDEILVVDFNNGYYSTVLGADPSNALDDSILNAGGLWLEVEINNNGPLSPRQQINGSPYATMAKTSESLDGGTVNAATISVNGGMVIDAAGNWVGPSIGSDWSGLLNVPGDIADGDADTLAGISCASGEILGWDGSQWTCASDNGLTESEVEAFVTNDPLDFASGTTVGGESIVTPSTDSDTLGGLICGPGEIAEYNGIDWECQAKGDGFPLSAPGPCNPSNAGAAYFDSADGALKICDGADYLRVSFCNDSCPLESSVTCNTAIESECGDSCGTFGTALAVSQCDPSTIECSATVYDDCGNACPYLGTALAVGQCDVYAYECGATVYDNCGNTCPDTGLLLASGQCDAGAYECNEPVYDNCGNTCSNLGTSLNASQCPSAASTPCNQTVTDDCGNDCGDVGTYCSGGDTCTSNGCTSQIEHSDGFNIFYDTYPVNVSSVDSAIRACENHHGVGTCQQGSCGGATYVGSGGAPCSCGYRIWYFGNEGYGFLGNSTNYAGQTAISCQNPDSSWY